MIMKVELKDGFWRVVCKRGKNGCAPMCCLEISSGPWWASIISIILLCVLARYVAEALAHKLIGALREHPQ